jgi:hypothetical protein
LELSASVGFIRREWSYTCASPICLHGLDREIVTFLALRLTISNELPVIKRIYIYLCIHICIHI